MFVVVSRDTSSYARVGYGMQDQLIFASDDLKVYSDMDHECASIEEQGESSDDSSWGTMTIPTPVRATGVVAMSLAAAVARTGY